MDITKKAYALPSYTSVNTGDKMVQRFDEFVQWLKQNQYRFGTFKDFLETIKMKIGYDAKRFFHNTSGLGNYSRDLVRTLAEYFPENEYLLFAKNTSERTKGLLERSNIIFRKISKGNLARQMKMGKDAQNEECEIFHGLSGELPLKWNNKKIKKVVTIHDLIFLKYPQFYSFSTAKYIHGSLKSNKSLQILCAISEQTRRILWSILKLPNPK